MLLREIRLVAGPAAGAASAVPGTSQPPVRQDTSRLVPLTDLGRGSTRDSKAAYIPTARTCPSSGPRGGRRETCRAGSAARRRRQAEQRRPHRAPWASASAIPCRPSTASWRSPRTIAKSIPSCCSSTARWAACRPRWSRMPTTSGGHAVLEHGGRTAEGGRRDPGTGAGRLDQGDRSRPARGRISPSTSGPGIRVDPDRASPARSVSPT